MPSGFTGFDVIVIILIGLSTALAFAKGFTTVALSFASWVGALLVTMFGYSFAQTYARDLLSPVELADITTLAVLFMGSLLIFRLVAGSVGGAVKESTIGFLDRSLGALFGFLRGLVVVSVLYLGFAAMVPSDQPDWVTSAKTRPLVAWGADLVSALAADALGQQGEKEPLDALEEAQQKALEAAQSVGEDIARTYTDSVREGFEAALEDAAKEKKNDNDT